MFIELQKSNKANGRKRFTICNYDYFLERGKWEVFVINLRPIKYSLWIWRKRKYKNEWPVACGGQAKN